MRLGFYYHIPIHSSAEGLKVPAYLGVFLDTLATKVDSLVLFMHEADPRDEEHCDKVLKTPNIVYQTLGYKSPAWERFIWPWKTLKRISGGINDCDLLLIRAPSPLAPAFQKKFGCQTKIAYLVVGDYTEGVKHLDQPWWRKIPISILSYINDRQLSGVISKTKTLVNSKKLFEKYKPFVNDLHLVRTTTLSQSDFYYRLDTCQGEKIKLLYTGSFSFAKGLRELIEAFAILVAERGNLTLNFVGWEYDTLKPVEKYLKNRSSTFGIADLVFFHGYKTVGPELNEMYRMADIYILPSYHEGFPRTIWEAMANSLPVVATKVGSIPHYLRDMHDAILIEPQNVHAIVRAINDLLDDCYLRQSLIQNGVKLALENTLEVHTNAIVELLRN